MKQILIIHTFLVIPLVVLLMMTIHDIWHDPDYHNKIAIDGGLAVGNKGQLNCLCLTTGEVTVIKYEEGQPK
jgi:hypothetical protein